MQHHKNLAILVGGGPAPGINSVIGAATIRARLEGLEVIGVRDGFEWLMQRRHRARRAAHHRERQPDSLPRRLVSGHRPRQSDVQRRAARRHAGLTAASEGLAAHYHRRRRHGVLRDEGRGARRRRHPRRSRPEDHRQRPVPAGACRHLRFPIGAPLRSGDRQEPDGRRQDDVAVVFRDRHGAQGRASGAGDRQAGRHDADAHHRRVHRAAAA